jgi:hypothetical protein
VTFTDETGNRIAEPLTYTIENTEISLLEVPEKSHYTGVWEPFDLADGGDHVIRPVYTPIEYQVSFMVDGEIVHTATYNIEKTDIQIIELPERKHYTASWEEYDLSSGGDKVIHAVYTAIIYHVTFVDGSDDGIGAEMDYTVEDYGHVSMELPQKEHYTGKWEEYDLSDGGDWIIHPIYTPIEYRIEFVVDGAVIQTFTYTVESPEIEFPSIPEKAGFSAEWEAFDPTVYQDRVIHAVYTNLDTETETLPNIHTSGCNCSGVGGCNSFVGAMPLLGMVLCALLFKVFNRIYKLILCRSVKLKDPYNSRFIVACHFFNDRKCGKNKAFKSKSRLKGIFTGKGL